MLCFAATVYKKKNINKTESIMRLQINKRNTMNNNNNNKTERLSIQMSRNKTKTKKAAFEPHLTGNRSINKMQINLHRR